MKRMQRFLLSLLINVFYRCLINGMTVCTRVYHKYKINFKENEKVFNESEIFSRIFLDLSHVNINLQYLHLIFSRINVYVFTHT